MWEMADLLTNQLERNRDTREEDWKDWYHRNIWGVLIKIKDMKTSYIESCINKFKDRFNVSEFEKEIERRK